MNAAESAVPDPIVGCLILGVFSLLYLVLGWYWGHKDKELDEYVLAGRKLGLGLGAASAIANWVTSNTVMLAPQLVYEMGVGGMLGYALGSVGLLLFAPIARRIRTLMPAGYTAGDFIRLRYGKRPGAYSW